MRAGSARSPAGPPGSRSPRPWPTSWRTGGGAWRRRWPPGAPDRPPLRPAGAPEPAAGGGRRRPGEGGGSPPGAGLEWRVMSRHLAELYRYRALIGTLVLRELRARYRGSVLGFL